jgi:hypothetical protein
MRILIACEYTGAVRDAFRSLGEEAYSCDVRESDSKFHLHGDVRQYLNDGWDLMIAHPPCTHLAVSGARWFKDKGQHQKEALEFVRLLLDAPIPKIALENPVSIISTKIRKPDQIVQPWWFGDSYQKTTCLWLKGLPLLQKTNVVRPGEFVIHGGRKLPKWYSNRSRSRDATFPGMARAMAEQWRLPS